MPEINRYKVHPRGVKVDGIHRTVAHRDFVVGTTVEVRGFPAIPSRLYFGLGGRFCAEVASNRDLAEEERQALHRLNGQRTRTARSVAREARERLRAESRPDPADGRLAEGNEAVASTDRPSPRRRSDRERVRPDLRAAVTREWHDPTAEDAA